MRTSSSSLNICSPGSISRASSSRGEARARRPSSFPVSSPRSPAAVSFATLRCQLTAYPETGTRMGKKGTGKVPFSTRHRTSLEKQDLTAEHAGHTETRREKRRGKRKDAKTQGRIRKDQRRRRFTLRLRAFALRKVSTSVIGWIIAVERGPTRFSEIVCLFRRNHAGVARTCSRPRDWVVGIVARRNRNRMCRLRPPGGTESAEALSVYHPLRELVAASLRCAPCVLLPAAHTVCVLPVKVRPQELVMSLCSHTRRFIEATLGGESSKVRVLLGIGQVIHRAAA